MSKCNSCGREPLEYVTRCVRCGAAQPLESSGTQPTDVQQLKAEIAMCAALLEPLFGATEEQSKVITDVTQRLWRLSAV